jgi:glyoxylase-like metal-dependent hydrolase (beta-lactamase superfamily II)
MTRTPGASPNRSIKALFVSAFALTGSVAASQNAPNPRAFVQRAVDAMGGEQALRSLRSISIDLTTATFGIGQEETPDTPARLTATQTARTFRDHARNRFSTSSEIRPGGPTGVNRTRNIITPSMGMNETNAVQAPLSAAALAQASRLTNQPPERLLLWAMDNSGSLRSVPAKEWRNDTMDGVRLVSGQDSLALYFDRASGYLTVIEVVTDDPVLGDRSTAQMLTRWTPAGSLKYPRQIDVLVNGRVQSATTVTAVTSNAPLADSLFAIPDSIAARARTATPAQPASVSVQLNQLAPGVWRAEGGSHHSLVIEQPEGLLVVEGPQNAVRSRAVLDTLRSRFPGKAVRQVVNTHHHWDHSGGLREYMAAGIPVVTHARNVEFVRGIAAARKTVAPDELSRRPRAPVITAVRDSLAIGTGDARVVLYPLPTSHAEGLLVAFLPSHRLLFTSDVLTPGANLAPLGSAELVEFAQARRISVERFAGGHGGVAAWSDVERAAGR